MPAVAAEPQNTHPLLAPDAHYKKILKSFWYLLVRNVEKARLRVFYFLYDWGVYSLQHNPYTPGVPLTRSISYNTGLWVHILGLVYADHTVHTWAWVPSARSTKDVNHTTFYRPLASGHPPSCTTMLGNFSSACQRRQASTRCPVPSFILVLFGLWAVIMAACPLHKAACKSSTHCATFCIHRSRLGFRSID